MTVAAVVVAVSVASVVGRRAVAAAACSVWGSVVVGAITQIILIYYLT